MPAPLILAFDAACAACSVAVARVGASGGVETLASESRALERGHAAVLAPMIEAALAAAGVAPAALSLVAVTSGPGSFTGVRIALATARGLALALDIPVAAISTTSVVLAAASQADRARAAADRAKLVAAIDTRRD
ncbi:MAG: tRNA (adenosine(37)-N6)-threonylcarbamoyltransferase complex dimerization subunit type 1 TsaB, partial [Rhodospirillales bacterium]|nr:tRNA (adenosine(37)-N6)-threonylcarbamoyltransferase complex dimerization subunit type 1 TsaB [Rhodospirillales bacterium]